MTIRNSRISCAAGSGNVITLARGLSSVLLDRVEVNGLRRSAICVAHGGYVLRRSNVHDCVDGARAGSNTVIEGSYVHHLSRMPGTHNDAVQTVVGTNIVIRGNALLAYNPDTRDYMNAAYLFGPALGPVSRVTVVGNYLDGGNFTVSGSGEAVTVANNTFGPRHRYGALNVHGDVLVAGNRGHQVQPVASVTGGRA